MEIKYSISLSYYVFLALLYRACCPFLYTIKMRMPVNDAYPALLLVGLCCIYIQYCLNSNQALEYIL